MTVEIRGIRLTLRDFVAADEAAVHAYASDPVVTRFLVWGPNTVEDTHRFIRDAIACSQRNRNQGRGFGPERTLTAILRGERDQFSARTLAPAKRAIMARGRNR